MTLQQPMNLQALCYTAAEDRQALGDLVCGEGVVNMLAGGFLPTTTGPGGNNHSVSLAVGSAYTQNNDATDGGMYRVKSSAAEVVQVPIGGGGLVYRIDTIILRVRDSEYAGLDNDAVSEVVAGTNTVVATAGATGTAFTPAAIATAGAVPDNSLVIGYVRVLPADTLTSNIAAGDIFDARYAYTKCGANPTIRVRRNGAYNTVAAPAAIVFDTVSYNTFGGGTVGAAGTLFNTSTGEFTAPAVGLYRLSWAIHWTATAATDYMSVYPIVNAVTQAIIPQAAGAVIGVCNTSSVVVKVDTVGHKITLAENTNAAGKVALVGFDYYHFLTIEKIA